MLLDLPPLNSAIYLATQNSKIEAAEDRVLYHVQGTVGGQNVDYKVVKIKDKVLTLLGEFMGRFLAFTAANHGRNVEWKDTENVMPKSEIALKAVTQGIRNGYQLIGNIDDVPFKAAVTLNDAPENDQIYSYSGEIGHVPFWMIATKAGEGQVKIRGVFGSVGDTAINLTVTKTGENTSSIEGSYAGIPVQETVTIESH